MPGSLPTRSSTAADGSRVGQALGERRGGRAHEPAGGKHLEGAIALADEMRRRREAGVECDPATGEQCHGGGAREPARSLGGVARVGVLGQHDEERPAELLV